VSLLLSWLVFPALSLLVLWGCGLLVTRLSGYRPPLGLQLGLGLCVVIVVASLAAQGGATAPLATPAIVVLALAGFVLERHNLALRVDVWALAAVVGVFCVYAAPVVLSGEPTFGGYGVLGDTAVHFLASDQLLKDGYDLTSVPGSEYRSALTDYYINAKYPAGAQLGAAALRKLTGADIAWVFQPYLALLCALTAAALWSLVSAWIPRRSMRALVVFIAAQPALLYAYALEGSVKEIAAVFIIALIAALLPEWRRTCREGPRRALPLALATAAALNILSLSITPWLAPLLAIGLVMAFWGARLRGRELAVSLGLFALVAALLSIPVLRVSRSFVDVTTAVVTGPAEFGNLLGPLDPLQTAGIWLTTDFRLAPSGNDELWTYALLGVALIALVAALVWIFEEGVWYLLALVATMLVAYIYVTHRGSPWADAKALAITSPMLLLVVLLGAAALQRRLPVLGWTVTGLIAGGVVVSNALAYHGVALAPYDRLHELQKIGESYERRGPATLLDADEFAKHFLRGEAPARFDADVDALALDDVESRPLLIRRRSATDSRPPANFALERRGRDYEVWIRRPQPKVLRHVSLGTGASPVAVPACAKVRELARQARAAGARIAAAEGRAPIVFAPSRLSRLPAGWSIDPNEPETIDTVGPGKLEGRVSVPRAGRYELWLEGSFGRPVEVRIDGRRVASVGDVANYRGDSVLLRSVTLPAGTHRVKLTRGGGGLRPGDGGKLWRVGRLWLKPLPDAPRVLEVEPGRAAVLCGRPLDWLEIVS
jgi:hypothetical protein